MIDRDIVSALVKVVELKDQSTAAHTWRVGFYTQALAEAAGVPAPEIARFMEAAVLHDIGKIDIPESVLGKPGPLNDEERAVMKTHAMLGFDRLVRMGATDPLLLGLVRSHHERLDGSGYPDGLSGEAVPRPARFFAVIDTFDAMTSLRAYRKEVGLDAAKRAIEELNSKAGLWYCPTAVALFTRVYESGALDWIMHHLNGSQSLIELPHAPDANLLMTARKEVMAHDRLVIPPAG